MDKAPEELKQKVRSGSTSITSAYQEITAKERNLPKQQLPKGEFDVLYADPPWFFSQENVRGSAQHHYGVLKTKEICNLKLPTAKNCILFLWVPNTHIFDAKEVLESWGFQYKTNFVWVKPSIGNGTWNRQQHELLFICIKGNFPTPEPSVRVSSVIQADRNKHSEKPKIVYKLIEKLYPKRKYLEIFARNKRKWFERTNCN